MTFWQVRLNYMAGDGDLIKAARERVGLTQQQLAQRVGATRNSVSNWEKGTPPRNKLGKLREELGLDENLLPISASADLDRLSVAQLFTRLQTLLAESHVIVAELAKRDVDSHYEPQRRRAPRHAEDSPGAVYYQEQPPTRGASGTR